jgi:Zn-dependent protease with chaperone function
MIALLTACVWHVVPNLAVASTSAVALVGAVALLRSQLVVELERRRATPRRLYGVGVHVLPAGSTACTAGPLLPRVFLGADLLEVLDDDELRAVVLHERAHQRGLDPLRAAVDGAVRRALPITRRREVTERHAAQREIRADRAALRRGASRRALAAALLKVPAAPAASVGFAPATELRVRALVDGHHDVGRARPRWIAHGLGTVLGLVPCLWGLHALLAAAPLSCCT